MPRIVKEHTVRRDEILDSAQRLINTKGYEQMTVQDILDELQIAKGTFYHYFDSKQALLEAFIERMIEAMEHIFRSVVDTPQLTALDKLNRFFALLGQYKTTEQTVMRTILRVWYTDDNALVRQKMRTATLERVAPLFAAVIHQGIEEGSLTTRYPDEAAEVVFSLAQDMVDILSHLLLSSQRIEFGRFERTVAAYTDVIERALGTPPHSLMLADTETLRQSIRYLSNNQES